jgi:hypothetical protein
MDSFSRTPPHYLKKFELGARFEVLTSVKIQIEVFRVLTPCNVIVG